jgi:ketosteroid isomerase-like protein
MDREAREVREANERFYRALNDLDLASMDRVWSHGAHVRCVHPGWELIVGWDAVRASWEGIFRATRDHSVEAAEIAIHLRGDLAWVCCIERITLSSPAGGGATSLAAATNLFERLEDPDTSWRMILHHASLLPVTLLGLLDSPEVVH